MFSGKFCCPTKCTLLLFVLFGSSIGQSIDYDFGGDRQQQQRRVLNGPNGPTGTFGASQQQAQPQQSQAAPMFGGAQLGQPQPQQQHPDNSPFTLPAGQLQQSQSALYGGGADALQRVQNSSATFGGNAMQQSRQIGGGTADGGENVRVEVQLRSFANAGFRLPGGRLCTCPAGNERCLQASPQRNGYNCLTSLTVFILSADEQMHFNQTPFFPLNTAGQIGQQEFGQRGTFEFRLDMEPSAIGIIVYNLGPQINLDGNLYETNAVTVVDTFIQTANGAGMMSPSGSGRGLFPPFGGGATGQLQNAQLQGQLLGTQLSLGFSVSCLGARSPDGRSLLVGPGCDLSCNSSAANPNSAICQSRRSGFFSLCRWINGNTQVADCKNCPWGIKESAYCADGMGGVLEPNHAGVVSSFYYSAFIGLSVFAGLLLLCLVAGCLILCVNEIRRRRDDHSHISRRSQQSRTASSNTHHGDPERVALTTAARPVADDSGGFAAFRLGPDNSKPPPPYSTRLNNTDGSGGRGTAMNPLPPAPRSNASTASAASGVAGRSTPVASVDERRFPPPPLVVKATSKPLFPPRFQPLPHIGPPSAHIGGADSLDSSFAGLPAPSVSADV